MHKNEYIAKILNTFSKCCQPQSQNYFSNSSTLFLQFIWRNKPSRIQLTVLQNLLEQYHLKELKLQSVPYVSSLKSLLVMTTNAIITHQMRSLLKHIKFGNKLKKETTKKQVVLAYLTISLLFTKTPLYLRFLEIVSLNFGILRVSQFLGICSKMEPFYLSKSSPPFMGYLAQIFSNTARFST